jgi:hypothetical protein
MIGDSWNDCPLTGLRANGDDEETFPVHDLAFYDAGCNELRGARRVVVPVRRLLRRLLRPIFLRQVELFQKLVDRRDAGEASLQVVRDDVDKLTKRQDEVDERVEAVLAFGWDYVAMVRRLAVLEDQLVALTGQATPAADEGESQPSILFPSLDVTPEARSKVC